MNDKNILISGASIAGPALAFWLSRYGFHPTIVECAPALRPGGYAVDFRGASLRVLERMGLLAEVQRMQTRIGAIAIVDRDNRKVASMPDGFTSGELEILRGDLARVFYEATCGSTEYIFGDSIAGIQEGRAGVDVQFQSGSRRTFDLAVGADGLHSKVRSLAFGEEANYVRYLGYYVSIFTIPNYLNLDRSGLYYGTPGKKVGIFSNGGDRREAKATFFFATEPSPSTTGTIRSSKRGYCVSISRRKVGRSRGCSRSWKPRLTSISTLSAR